MIGGLAKVVQDIPPFVIADGQPARCIGLNSVGLSRAGIPENVRRELKKAFRLLYRSGLNLGQAIAEMEQELDSSEEVEHFLRFLRNADRAFAGARKTDGYEKGGRCVLASFFSCNMCCITDIRRIFCII